MSIWTRPRHPLPLSEPKTVGRRARSNAGRPKSCESKGPRRCDEDFPIESGRAPRVCAGALFFLPSCVHENWPALRGRAPPPRCTLKTQGVAMANKEAAVAELTERFESSTAVLLTEYRGLTVAKLKELRKSISGDASYAVVKNTLTKIAANNAGISAFDDERKGPSAIAFVHGDPVAVAKS